jgi:hypothetical protein
MLNGFYENPIVPIQTLFMDNWYQINYGSLVPFISLKLRMQIDSLRSDFWKNQTLILQICCHLEEKVRIC